jgi:prepilin signal peptidase PulO-like enzyme (type II secretory pathway)
VIAALDAAAVWIIPIAVLGAIVGSFLNVVIFRLPRGLSISRPRWSFCPHCEHRIRPIHNVPILSWFWLRGRCRTCGEPIALIYPVIECATLLLFITIWDALFVAGVVPTVNPPSPGADWPMAVAYISLFAGLLAMSGMDIESYTIDIRISVVGMAAGIACHTVWGIPDTILTPAAARPTGALPPVLCLIGIVMGLTWLVTTLIVSRAVRRQREGAAPGDAGERDLEASGREGEAADADVPTAYTHTAGQVFQPLPIAALCCVILALAVWQMLAPGYQVWRGLPAGGQRGFVACFLFMLMLILASMVKREADEEIVEEIEAQRKEARPMALREFARFIPALAVGIGLFVLLQDNGHLNASWRDAVDAAAGLGPLAPHAAGAVQAMGGMVCAAGLGWFVRILFTLAFGKEAFGTGDIYILAAIGAVAGYWAAVFSFFLAAILALVGVLAVLFRKTSRAIPFGPWLAMGALVTLYLQGLLLAYFGHAAGLVWETLCGHSF